MWMSVLAVALLSFNGAQPGKLSVSNDRLTYGHLGPARDNNKYLPGDVVHFAYEIQNMTFDAAGKASYALSLEITDPKGVEILKQKARPSSTQNYLGGTSVPAAA